jgi:RNA polymerase sigma-70 factor (ECF subfamily)
MGRFGPELLMAEASFSPSPAPIDATQEAALIQRAQRGDRDSFNAIMDLYRERVVRMAFHMVGNREDAQDLCQETFVKVYRALGSFDRKRAFSPWLYRIAHNVVLDFLRRKKVRPALMEPDPDHPLEEGLDPQAETPQEALLSQEMRREVMQAIQSLPENYRSVVVFRFVDELSYAEIADALDLTESNVMMRMSRARRMLRDKLNHLHSEDSLP